MFLHNFKYSLKTLLRNKMLLFWTFAFPIILGIFFNMAFSNIENSEKLDIINVAIIDNEAYNNNEFFKEAFKALSDEKSEDRMFNTKYLNLEEAQSMLENDEIIGYLLFEEDDIKIVVNSSGINETILRYVVDEMQSNIEIIKTLAENNIEKEYKQGNFNIDYKKIFTDTQNFIKDAEVNLNDISNSNLSYTMIEYYTLIAMACLYGGTLSMVITNYSLANMKSVGKRTSVSPIKKGRMILGGLLASYLVQLLGIAILFVFTIFALHVDFSDKLLPVLGLACAGSLAGLSLGVAVATLIKTNENAKTGILIAITMFGCFLSGMMGITMKYIIDKNVPILNKINPASMITDGFYSLYYYNTLDRFYFNLVSLLIFSALLIAISIKGLRRQRYDNI